MGISDRGIAGDREFPTTSWSLIANARDRDSPAYERHLGRLVERYWRPVFCVIRWAFGRDHDEAKDLTQEFFATVILDRHLVETYAPERGSFRALLRAALRRFMVDVARGLGARKRGAGFRIASIEALGLDEGETFRGQSTRSPEDLFDEAWNAAVLDQAVAELEERLAAQGRADAFAIFRAYDLDGDSAELSYAELGKRLGKSGDKVKHALTHARSTFREIVTDAVRVYVDDPDELVAELKRVFGA